jgi:hypothetical protein
MQDANKVLALQMFDDPDDDTPIECVSNISGCPSGQSIVKSE